MNWLDIHTKIGKQPVRNSSKCSLRKLTKAEIERFSAELSLTFTEAKDITDLFYHLKKSNHEILHDNTVYTCDDDSDTDRKNFATYEDYFYEYDNQWFRCDRFKEFYEENLLQFEHFEHKPTIDEYKKMVLGKTVFWLPKAKKYLVHM